MRLLLILLFIPLISFSQSKIAVFINGQEITKESDCQFYAKFGDMEINLKKDSLYQILQDEDLFFICSDINQVNFKSNNLKLMRKVDDFIVVRYNSKVDESEIKSVVESDMKCLQKIEIVTLRDSCVYYLCDKLISTICDNKPAYFLDGKPIYDENPRKNRKHIRKIKKKYKMN